MEINNIHKVYNSNAFWIFLILINVALVYLTGSSLLHKVEENSLSVKSMIGLVADLGHNEVGAAKFNIKTDRNEIYINESFVVYTENIVDNFKITYSLDGKPNCINNNMSNGCIFNVSRSGKHFITGCIDKLKLCDTLVINVMERQQVAIIDTNLISLFGSRFDGTISNLPDGEYEIEVLENGFTNNYIIKSMNGQSTFQFLESYINRPDLTLVSIGFINGPKIKCNIISNN